MRGADSTQESLFTTVHLENFVSENHPLRKIKVIFNSALKRIDWLLDGAYSDYGRESIPLSVYCERCFYKCSSPFVANVS